MRLFEAEREYFGSVFGLLIGSALGDGCFIRRTPNHNVYLTIKHAANQFGYLHWKRQLLASYVKAEVKDRNFTEGRKETWQPQKYFSTVSLPLFNAFYQCPIPDLLNQLDDLAFAVWFLDDGNRHKSKCTLTCARFTPEEKELAASIIRERWSLNCHAYHHPRKGYINFKVSDFTKIVNMIKQVVPAELDVLYKIKGVNIAAT